MRYKCLIVDDEPLALNIIESYISFIPSLVMTAKCTNAFEAMNIMQSAPIDIIFLDVEMPQLTGTNFIRSLLKPPKVIFTTAHKEFASDAFELDAVDYLIKPISLERFIRAINKIDRPAKKENTEIDVAEQACQPFLYFRVDRQMVKVLLNQIIYIESLRDYVKIVCDSAPPIMCKQTIMALEEMLPRKKFLRIHRSYIVAAEKINSFTSKNVLIGDHAIPVGRAYKHQMSQLTNSK